MWTRRRIRCRSRRRNQKQYNVRRLKWLTASIRRIVNAVKAGKLKEPFSKKDFRAACVGLGNGTYAAFSDKHSAGNPGHNSELFSGKLQANSRACGRFVMGYEQAVLGGIGRSMNEKESHHRAVVITALPLECRAVCKHLKNLRAKAHPRGTVYEVGVFDGGAGRQWDVLVVEAGAGNTGAAAEVERAIAFYNPELAFFVGVAGGVKDVSLGDVVVASKVYSYESGKDRAEFESRPELYRPSYALEQRVKAEIRHQTWTARVRERGPESVPKARFGAIAAGEKVIASTDSATNRFLKERYSDVLAVEMEGYGFLRGSYMNQGVGALVVRGISDLIDGKSAADASGSQEAAAEAASAFVFELLSHLGDTRTDKAATIDWVDSSPQEFTPDPRVELFIKGIKLAQWKKAADAALRIVALTDHATGRNEIFEALFAYQECSEEDDRFWGASHTLECCVKIAPWLITRARLSQMAEHENFTIRSSAASICMDLAHSAPALVPVDILLKLSAHDEDWYVEAPANAALKEMGRLFPDVLNVFYSRLRSAIPEARAHAASHICSIATEEPELLDAERLAAEIKILNRIGDTESKGYLTEALEKAKTAKRAAGCRYGL